LSGVNNQLALVISSTREIRKRTSASKPRAESVRIEREGRSISANLKRLLGDIPDTGYRSAC
jgi:hypothetical protein